MERKIDYIFKQPLLEGIIVSRPNRFIMNVKLGNIIYECHCPSTGRIGNIKFSDIPCLISSQQPNKKRRTLYTVEAISLDNVFNKSKGWIGINQYKTNDYIEFFIKSGQLNAIIKNNEPLKREVKLGDSKIDFLVDKTFIEIKTYLDSISVNNTTTQQTTKGIISDTRVLKHYKDLTKNATKSILILCYFYNSKLLESCLLKSYNKKLIKVITEASANGVETWQVNFIFTKEKVGISQIKQLSLK